MKTSDLIAHLNKLDPEGTMEVFSVSGPTEEPLPITIFVDRLIGPHDMKHQRTSKTPYKAILI